MVPFYISTSNIQEMQFLKIVTSTSYYESFWDFKSILVSVAVCCHLMVIVGCSLNMERKDQRSCCFLGLVGL